MDQLGIALFGVAAIWLSQDSRPDWRKWACVFGLIAQPFWFYATWQAGQIGMFLLCFLYSAAWARGFHANWIKKVSP